MRKPLIIANWKMNHSIEDSLKFITVLQNKLTFKSHAEVVICPPYTALYSLSVLIQEKEGLILGAQNCYYGESGAFTGEISPVFLAELGVSYVIVGHSERRNLFGETDELISQKVQSVLACNMKPIICIGETINERNDGKTLGVIENQLKQAISLVDKKDLGKIVIAYEPIWAIGTKQNATTGLACEAHQHIRGVLVKISNQNLAHEIRIIYGGSVQPTNINELMREKDIDGALIGGASLEVDSFLQMINYHEIQ